MLSKLLVFCFISVNSFAVVWSAVSVDKITASGARITWTTDVGTNSVIQWGIASGVLTSTNNTIVGQTPTAHQFYVSGAPPNTLIYYKVCSAIGTCDATERTFTTAALPSPYPALPVTPSALSLAAMPTITGTSLTVATDCSDFSTHINTLKALDGNLNHEIVIPAGTICVPHSTVGTGDANQSQFLFPVKTGTNPSGTGVIIIRSAAILPPEGARITSAWNTSYFINTTIGISETATAPSFGGACVQGQMYWDFLVALGSTWALKECTTPALGTGGYTLVAKSTFTGTPPTSCTANTWYQKTDASDVAHGIYRCDDLGRILQVQLGLTAAFNVAAGAKGYRFVGITFDSLRWQSNSPPIWVTGNNFVAGSYYYSLFNFTTSSNIAMDRCRFIGGSYPNRYQNYILSSASNVYISNNSFEGISLSLTSTGGGEPSNQTEYTGFNLTGGTGVLIDNNYIEGPGIVVHGSDDSPASWVQDVRITRNYFYVPDTYYYGTVGSNGRFYHNRHAVEMKRGQRWLIQGNIFDGGFATVNQAHAVDVSYRPNGQGATVLLEDIDIVDNVIANKPNGIYLSGHNDSDADQGQVVRRIRIQNNLIYGIDGDRYPTGYFQRQGNCILTALGGEDLLVKNNTCIQTGNGQYPAIMLTDTAGGLWGSLFYLNNVATHVPPGNSTTGISRANNAARGTPTLVAAFQQYLAAPNTFVNLNGQLTTDYPANNTWPASVAALGFFNASANNYRFKGTSSYAYLGHGANPDDIKSANGEVYNPRALSVASTTATIAYTAPNSTDSCTIEYGTSPSVGTGSRIVDSVGSRFRTKGLTLLTGGTTYYYRIYCKTMISGTFRTL